jgi:hypothetical protein
VKNVLWKNCCGPVFIFQLEIVPVIRSCISDLIKLHSSGVAGCKDIPAKQFFISRPALASRTNLMRIDGLSEPQLNHRRRQYGSLVDRIGATALGAP